MASDFVHLHVHTDYSMLDGAAKIKKLVAKAADLGQKAIAITDHGYLFGAYEMYREAKAVGIKPIIGLEAYVTPGTSRFDLTRVRWGDDKQDSDDVSARGAYTHMTLLSRTTEGMHNLFRMGSLASLEGQFGKWPRLDRELLNRYSKGLIGTTGCPSGEVQTRIRLGQWDEAVRAAGELQDIFGSQYFYVELMDHGIELERRVKNDLLRLAKTIGAPLLATNDSHYVSFEDRSVQDALLCINSGANLDDPNRFRFDGSDYYLRTSEQMRELFSDVPEACDNTLLVAEQCDVQFNTVSDGANYMPVFQVPPGENGESWFVKEVERGLNIRFPQGIPDQVRKQAEYEVSVITQMGFPGYFLVVADFIQWAKSQGIRVGPGRGSGAGSMVAYAMQITELNPLEHGLIFERFLNPERVSMPDFDVDFDDRRRGEVIEYVVNKYGQENVAQVVTYGTIKAKQALKDSARIMGYPYNLGDNLTKAMPPAVMGKDITVSGIFNPQDERYKEAEEFRKMWNDSPDVQRIVELAKGLEGVSRQWGVHACAVIMSSHPLQDIIPVMKRLQDGAIITQFDYPTCETLGLLKMDFLGLKNLTIITDALEHIAANGKPVPDLDHLPLDDKATYDLLASGDTLGVFQLDGGGMRTLLRQLNPDNFEDISAVVALYRPGPMGAESHTKYARRKNNLEQIQPIHPELEESLKDILSVTYGLIIYQEQVMAIAREVAGFTLGQADVLRRAMGKKKKEILDQQFAGFAQGMKNNGYSQECINTLWEILVPFSDYAFNKSHSAAYGLVAYWTGYLKANFPVEYMAALLTSAKTKKDKMTLYLGETRHMNIKVSNPDVNMSASDFTPVGEQIRFGLSAIRNVGEAVVEQIVEARNKKGNFTSFADFLDKVPVGVCNKRVIESLIKAGAFDSLGQSRRGLIAIHEDAINAVIGIKRKEAEGQLDLFSTVSKEVSAGFQMEVPDLEEWDKKEKLGYERELLGLYVSDHPLNGLDRQLRALGPDSIGELLDSGSYHDGARVEIAGLVTSVMRKTSQKGNLWAQASIEDLSGEVEVVFFPNTYVNIGTELMEDAIVTVRGILQKNDDRVNVRAQDMSVINLGADDNQGPLVISMNVHQLTKTVAESLLDIFQAFPGTTPVHLRLFEGDTYTHLALDPKIGVMVGSAIYGSLKSLLGANCV